MEAAEGPFTYEPPMSEALWPDPEVSPYLHFTPNLWWYWDEKWKSLTGPFNSRAEAVVRFKERRDFLRARIDPIVWIRTTYQLPPVGESVIGRGPDTWPERIVVHDPCKRGFDWFTVIEGVQEATPAPTEWQYIIPPKPPKGGKQECTSPSPSASAADAPKTS